MLVPPLRAPLEYDIKGSLSSWLDETKNNVGFLSSQVNDDLDRLASLRNSLVQAGNDHKKALDVLQNYKTYHAALLGCEAREFPSHETPSSARHLKFPWQAIDHETTEVHSHLAWERANILWNVAALLAYQASIQQKRDRTGWNQSHLLLQDASSTLVHLINMEEECPDFVLLGFWKSFLLAQAQIATYYMALSSPKPRHVVLAKIASAAVSLFAEASRLVESHADETYQVHCKSWNMWMLALAQYHESSVHRQKKARNLELARLQRARDAISSCQETIYSIETEGLEMLQGEVPKMIRTIRSRLLELQNEYDGQPAASLKDIRGEVLVKDTLPLSKALTSLKQPLFQNVQKLELTTASRPVILKFQQELDTMVRDTSQAALDAMEEARLALAAANLPHSLTAYKQKESGGGIPIDLWERIEAIQDQGLLSALHRELWEVRELAETAGALYEESSKQLAVDLDTDRQFRQQKPHFQGRYAAEVHRSFRSSLEKYHSLLSKARKGDEILIRRLDCLGTDPKYKLLQVQKSHLDKLLPGGEEGAPIDTSHLARLLVSLSSLFEEREELLYQLKEEASNSDFAERVAEIDATRPTARKDYERVLQMTLKAFGDISNDIRTNVSQQQHLMDSILEENEQFVAARDAESSSTDNENYIAMVDSAIEEVEHFRKHLREGKEFYHRIIPKLRLLKNEIKDASARLTVERCEYEDRERSRLQETDDAHLAASLAGAGPGNSNGGDPGLVVDDSKVASLVAMDFDPDKVVAALRKHNNDMDRALDELLC
jgi:hypothetical protein